MNHFKIKIFEAPNTTQHMWDPVINKSHKSTIGASLKTVLMTPENLKHHQTQETRRNLISSGSSAYRVASERDKIVDIQI